MEDNKITRLEEAFDQIMNVGFCIIPYKDLSDIFDENVMVYGTTIDEKITSLEGVIKLFKSQFEQMSGLDPSVERKRILRNLSPDGDNAYIIEEASLQLSSESDLNKIFLRISSVFHYSEGFWKLKHWHTSTPVDTENDHWHLEEWKREKKKLQKLVDQQTADLQTKNRELEVEAAIERVRARTMAMQKSEELADVAFVLFEELRALGGNLWGTGFGLCEEYSDKDTFWFANENGVFPPASIPNTVDTAHKQMYEGWKAGKDIVSLEASGEALKSHYDYMLSLPDTKSFFQKIIDEGLSFPEWQQWNAAYFKHGYLLIITLSPYPEHDILVRFAKVFNQTYTRFLDLKKAEAQARESEIQLSLERVRARSMAMHKSEELADLSLELVQQVHSLGIDTWFCAFNIYDDNTEGSMEWGSNGHGTFPEYRTPREGVFLKYYKAGQAGEKLLVNHIDEKECPKHYEYLCSLPGVGEQLLGMKEAGIPFPKAQIDHAAFFKYGYILFITFEPKPEAHDIFKRFASVFEQTYTRFLDLQKAEEQAQDSKIEAALERVRSQSLAMHHSDELKEVVSVLFEKLKELQIPFTAVGIATRIEDSKDLNSYVCGENEEGLAIVKYRLPYFENQIPKDLFSALENQVDFYKGQYSKEEKDHYYEYLIEHAEEFKQLPEDIKQMIFDSTVYKITMVSVKNAVFGINDFEGKDLTDKQIEIIKRFARVFDQAYTRFLDLEKSEAQAREAQVNLAVERVRARALGMYKSEEILEVANQLREELMGLNIPSVSAATIHLKEDDGSFRAWDLTSINDEENGLEISLDIRYQLEDTHPDFFMREVWEREEDYFVVIQGEDRFKHTANWLLDNGHPKPVEDFLEFVETTKLEKVYHPTVPLEKGRMTIDLLEPPVPEVESILKKMAGAFDLAYKRFEDLKKSEEQLWEVKVENALEKLRSRTMGMQNSEELQEVAALLFSEVQALGIPAWSCGYNIVSEDKKVATNFMSNEGTLQKPFDLPLTEEESLREFYEFLKSDESFFVQELEEKRAGNCYNYMASLPQLVDVFEGLVEAGVSLPTFQINHLCKFKHGYLLFITYEPVPKAHEIFRRFTKVFEQTYTRFLDIKKAEAQAQEAKIGAALEKVRSRTMGMQSSEELPEVANMLFLEVQALGIPAWSCGYCILLEDQKSSTCIMSSEGTLPKPFELPHHGEKSFDEWDKFIHSDETFMMQELGGADIKSHYGFMLSLPQLKPVFEGLQDAGLSLPSYQINHLCKFTHGFLLFITYEEVPGSHDIFKRFTRVFDQTYTRFLDLERAEAQAREAKIETALEKIRSRTMGMQKGEELQEVAVLLYKELISLGVTNFVSCGYVEVNEEVGRQHTWITSPGGDTMGLFHLPIDGDATFDERYAAWKRQQPIFHQSVGGQVRSDHLEYAITTFGSKEAEEMVRNQFPDPTVFHCFNFSHGYLHTVGGSQLKKEEELLLARFTKVFEQTYTRFLDLQKAEAQARESQVELSLERIRAEVASMQKSSDLFDIVVSMRKEFLNLGHHADYFWHMSWLSESYEMSMTSEDGSRVGMVISLPKMVHDDIPALANWEKGNDPTFVLALNAEDAWKYIDNMNTHGDYELADPNAPSKEDIEHIGGLTFIIARTSHGEIGYSLPGMVPEPPQEDLNTLIRFAGVFDLAYKRFEDLQAAERQAQLIKDERDRLEVALGELRATQEQLVQQEKLASLGQLTAGIAHEIKNPLNFVNNFSDLSMELIEETKEELSTISDKISKEDLKKVTDALEILQDIDENLQKIHKHGKRADSIVKSMLQHSRGGSGIMQATDLNSLVEEYANLAFHGMRAGKKSINVTIKKELDPSITQVLLIEEDFTRVILNLFNNAFDAMRETEALRAPVLTVRTHKNDKNISIEIEDNGSGIPEEIKDKILQPFFTTKKGTEGTGLGLSITHDIIKAHGGELKVKSEMGKGTVFIISLPASKQM